MLPGTSKTKFQNHSKLIGFNTRLTSECSTMKKIYDYASRVVIKTLKFEINQIERCRILLK